MTLRSVGSLNTLSLLSLNTAGEMIPIMEMSSNGAGSLTFFVRAKENKYIGAYDNR